MRTRRTLLGLAIGVVLLGAPVTDKRYIIVLIGPTGSGKTTQSKFLNRKYGTPTITVEDLIKENPAALAKYSERGIDSGPPQESPAINDLIADRLSKMDLSKGVVLDGYPATKDQADYLARLVTKVQLPGPVVIQLDVPDDVVRKRLAKRQREDDTADEIERRLKDYHREMDMVRAYYPQANIWTIDGTKSPEYVSRTIQTILEDELPKRTPKQ